jgi:hypothetical protein
MKISVFLKNRQIDNTVTDRNTGAGNSIRSLKDSERQILDREIRTGGHVRPTLQPGIVRFAYSHHPKVNLIFWRRHSKPRKD